MVVLRGILFSIQVHSVLREANEKTENATAAERELDIPFASPGMKKISPLRSEIFPIPCTRTGGFCFEQIPDSVPGGAQNPTVLLPLERVCITRKHPLSSVSGRKRYNTLDFSGKVVCHETAGFIGFFLPRQRRRLWIPLPTGRCSPLLETQRQRGCSPLNSPNDPGKMCHKLKKSFVRTFPKNEKISQVSSGKKMISVGFSMPHSFEIHASLGDEGTVTAGSQFCHASLHSQHTLLPAPRVRNIRDHKLV